ncbi:MAG: Maf family protein [Clostridia bacterium]|nr:Maf family protein [Clostridia bacterium]
MNLKDYRVILASGSPRRIQMLQEAGAEPRIIKPQCEELLHMPLEPQQIVMSLALKKGQWVENKLAEENDPVLLSQNGPALLIASDTIVYCDRVMGKPEDQEDAFKMLSELKNRTHSVFSGVYLNFIHSGKKIVFFDETKVFVNDYTDDWLRSYIATGEPMDKAGGYAIQGIFGSMIDHFEGDYDNVVGLPLEKILQL